MDGALRARIISGEEAASLMNRFISTLRGDLVSLQRIREAFSCEFEGDPNRFVPADSNLRSYCEVSFFGRNEALVGIRFDETNTAKASISSIGRIIKKNEEACDGWQYLDAVAVQILFPKNVLKIDALIMAKGGLNAFQDLKDVCNASGTDKGYWVDFVQGYQGVSAWISRNNRN